MFWEHDDGMRPTTRRAQIIKVDDSKSQQRVDFSGLAKEKPKKIWRPQDFGYSSNPPKDSDGVMIQMGSRSDRTLYLDGGHKDYRPKNTPEGGTVLFDHTGDIIRIFPDRMDHVHAKEINIRIGHGYKTGDDSGGGEAGGEEGSEQREDDESDKDEKTISMVYDGEKIVVTFENAKVTWTEDSLLLEKGESSTLMEDSKITHKAQHVVVITDRCDLGEEGGQPVGLCGGGCATKVFAV
jgi:hypothetical protein